MSVLERLVFSLIGPEKYRKWLLKKIKPQSPLHSFLTIPLPPLHQKVLEADFVVLDFETTGLNPKKDRIVSIGFVVVQSGKICLNQSYHSIILQNNQLTKQSVGIHKITDEDAKGGMSLLEGLEQFIKVAKGKAIIAHHHKIEKGFLNQAFKQLFNCYFPCYYVDTLKIEKRKKSASCNPNETLQKGYRLYQLKEDYNLPQYRAHHALEDAIGTAELFLAQIQKNYPKPNELKLKSIVCNS